MGNVTAMHLVHDLRELLAAAAGISEPGILLTDTLSTLKALREDARQRTPELTAAQRRKLALRLARDAMLLAALAHEETERKEDA